jgi:mannose-1-phosphate guanylyltransferase/mannose-6-phosphate isomerase
VHREDLHAVILAGGSGTRFWPLSRDMLPKQLLRVFGDRTMLEMTVQRVEDLVERDRIWVVTTREQQNEVRRELTACGRQQVRILAEPAGRNTAAAIGLAAARIAKDAPRAAMVVLPADHYIEEEGLFVELLRIGRRVAEAGWLVTLGIRPSRPETGYGYMARGAKIEDLTLSHGQEIYEVDRFTEKPDPDTAEKYWRSGIHYWNSGVFVWRVEHFMEEMERFLPLHHRSLVEIGQIGYGADAGAIAERYQRLDSVSVDYGIMEKAERVAMIPADVGWSDVGSWAALRELLAADRDGNVVVGDVVALDSRDSLVYAQDRLVSLLGLEKTVVVDTPDALLVCPENRSQDVRKVVEELRRRGREETRAHRMVQKPWGAYKVLDRQEGYQLKWLDVLPGQRLSLQSHRHRAEHWIVVRGTATVFLDGRSQQVGPNEHVYIPQGSRHRVENRGTEKVRMIEVQTGGYLGEDDIERHEDDYGRIEGP